ncbi:MAG: PAS domain-containing protein, partial [Bacteroidales bacterium]
MNKEPSDTFGNSAGPAYLKLIEDSPDGFLVIDKEGVGLFANKKTEILLLRDSSEIIGKKIGLPVFSKDSTELELPRKDGSVRIVELRVVETVWNNKK